jgi:flavin-dependent dehydrogenase
MQYVMADTDCHSNEIEMYFGNQVAPGGYAWIIPKGDSVANVGLGIRSQFSSEGTSLRSYLEHFVHRHPVARLQTGRAKIVSKVAALIPVGGPVRRSCTAHAILAGDAAGHVMACNGGGIPGALIDGEIAGLAAMRHIFEGVPLSWYEDTWRMEIGAELKTALTIQHIADQVMPSDIVTDTCMRLAGSHFLEPLIRCRLPVPVDIASKTFVRMLRAVT